MYEYLWGLLWLVFLGAAGHYVFLWLHVSVATPRERIVSAVFGICWSVVGTLAAFTALYLREHGEGLLVLRFSSITGSLLPNGAVRRRLMIPLLAVTPVSGLLVLVVRALSYSTE